MKICLITGAYPPLRCGVGDYTDWLARHLAAQGASVSVLTSHAARAAAHPKVSVHADLVTWSLTGLFALMRSLIVLAPHVVHLQYPSVGYGRGWLPIAMFPWLALVRPSLRRVITLHEYAAYSWRGKARLLPALACAHAVICTNHHDRRALVRFQPGVRAKIRVIPLGSNVGTDRPLIFPVRHRGPAAPSRLTWLAHFGTVMPNKGWEILLPALRQLRESGESINLLVAGELQPRLHAYHKKIRGLIDGLGLGDCVRFTGFAPGAKVREVFRQSCGIAVLPYTSGASLNRGSLVASLANGLAVVTTEPRFPMEQLRPGRHYWSVAKRDPRALAEAIRDLVNDSKLTMRLQHGARAAAGRFAWKRIARLTLGVYARLLGQWPAPQSKARRVRWTRPRGRAGRPGSERRS